MKLTDSHYIISPQAHFNQMDGEDSKAEGIYTLIDAVLRGQFVTLKPVVGWRN